MALLIADLQGADFDVSLTGFDPEELEDLFREDTKKGVQDDNFDVDAELVKPTFSKTGDLWLLGDHRLVCGDSTKPETYELLMNGKKANLVVTDPPYNVNYEGSAGKIKNDNMKNDAFYEKFCDVIVKRYIEQIGSHEKVSVIRDGLTYSYDEIAPEAEDGTLL